MKKIIIAAAVTTLLLVGTVTAFAAGREGADYAKNSFCPQSNPCVHGGSCLNEANCPWLGAQDKGTSQSPTPETASAQAVSGTPAVSSAPSFVCPNGNEVCQNNGGCFDAGACVNQASSQQIAASNQTSSQPQSVFICPNGHENCPNGSGCQNNSAFVNREDCPNNGTPRHGNTGHHNEGNTAGKGNCHRR